MKTKIFLNAFLALILFQGCEKDLQENPRTILNPQQFLDNPGSFETSVMGIYSNLPLYVDRTHEMITDIYAAPDASVEQALPVYNNQPTPSYYNARDAWNAPYSMIKNANFILEYLPEASISDNLKKTLVGEASFLRAYALFNLVQLFGDIPMPLEVHSDYNSLKLPRTPQAEVYEQIIKDLNVAKANLNPTSAKAGRVNKFVATGILARVYLTMAGNPLNKTEYYKDALANALEVINSSNYQLLSDYSKVFHNLGYTKESIWEKQYVAGRGGNFIHNIACTADGYKPTLVPSQQFISSFEIGDNRKEWGIKINFKDGDNKVLERPFFHKFVDTTLIKNSVLPAQAQVSYSIPLVRLAEMYLIAAEAENAINGPNNAYEYINEIRKRARVDKNNAAHVPDLKSLSKEQFQAAVWKEWDRELYQEGLSWMIMKRTNSFNRIRVQRGSTLTVPIGAYNQTWLIPIEEITNNNIPQNPLYQ